jgi:hypothetical protein
MPLDAYLYALTENTGFTIDDDNFNIVAAAHPELLAAWIAAAGRYAAADYNIQLLRRSIAWAREEVSPQPDVDTDEIVDWAHWLSDCVRTHQRLTAAREAAFTEFERACRPLLTEVLLVPDGIHWQPHKLIPDGLAAAESVQVPGLEAALWPMVLAPWPTLATLAAANLQPTPSRPAVRRTRSGFNQVDHQQRISRLLPRRDGFYLLRGFAWHTLPTDGPADAEPVTLEPHPTAAPTPQSGEDRAAVWLHETLPALLRELGMYELDPQPLDPQPLDDPAPDRIEYRAQPGPNPQHQVDLVAERRDGTTVQLTVTDGEGFTYWTVTFDAANPPPNVQAVLHAVLFHTVTAPA